MRVTDGSGLQPVHFGESVFSKMRMC